MKKAARKKKEAVKGSYGVGQFLQSLRDPQRFEKLSDGWVKDRLLGLDWGPSSDKIMVWEEAKKYCVDLGGRLPTVEELSSLIDYTQREPAINKDIFSDTKTNNWYWTGSEVAGDSASGWFVGFYYGDVNYYDKDNDNYVRPVRVGKGE